MGKTLVNFGQTDFYTPVNIAELRRYPSSKLFQGANAYMDSDVSIGDNGGGFYVYSTTSTAADTGKTVLKPEDVGSSEPGRWIQNAGGLTGPTGPIGDAGGNVMAIGPFTAAAGSTVPTGANLLQTSGYSTVDHGIGQYVYDATVDGSFVAANPLVSFQTSDGRGFKLSTQGSITLAAFGFKGDGVTDDTNAWRAAIKYAGTYQIGTIVVPRGKSLVSGSIVDQTNLLAHGIKFIGESGADAQFQNASRLIYSGSGTCWSIAYRTGGGNSIGGWQWENLAFQTTNAAGTMFDFGDATTHVAHDNPSTDPYQYLIGIEFKKVNAFGANGTGDFIRACKTFHLHVDKLSAIYSFRRGVWLNGCDNCVLEARFAGNNTSIRIDRNNEFGNNNTIDIAYCGGTDTSFGGELAYGIIDNASQTYIGTNTLFEGFAMHGNIFLGGYGTQVHAPQYGNAAPMFELGPMGREIALYSPRCTVIAAGLTPIISDPTSFNFGGTQSDYRIRIYDAPQSIQAVIPNVPRVLMFNATRNASRYTPSPLAKFRLDATGVEEESHICTAYNYWGTPGSPGGGGLKSMVADGASGRYVMHLTKDTPNEQGIQLNFTVGVDIQPRVYKLVNRMRLDSGTSNAGWALIVIVNGAFFSNAFNFATSSNYATYADTLDLSAVAIGSPVTINLYNLSAGATGVDLYVDSLGLIPVSDGGWTAGTGTVNKAAYTTYTSGTVSTTYSASQVQDIINALAATSQRVLALEQALRKNNTI